MTNKILPQVSSSDTLSQASKPRGSVTAKKLTNATDVPTTVEEEEENAMEQLARLERRMKLSRLASGMRSLKCLLFVGVLALIVCALSISIVWFVVFLSTMIRFGDSVRENTFQQLRANLEDEMHRMIVAAVSVASATTGFESTTPMDTMRDALLTTQFSLQEQFHHIGVSFYPMNMRGAFSFSNLFDPKQPELVGGFVEFKTDGALFAQQQFVFHNMTSGVTDLSPKMPVFFSFAMPQDFVQHVKEMNHSRPVAFTKPVPSFCFADANVPGWEDGICLLSMLKLWSHQMYSNASLGVQSSVLLSSTTDAFSEKLTKFTRSDSMSYVLTEDSKLIAVSRGLDRIREDEKKWRLYKYNTTDPTKSPLIYATEYPDEMVSKSANALMTLYGSQISESQFSSEPHALSVDGYTADYQVIQLTSNLDVSVRDYIPDSMFHTPEYYMRRLVLVHVIPNDAFTRTSINTGIIVISLASFGSFLSLVVVIVVSCCINRPVQKLIRQMNSAKDLELDKIDVSRFTYFSELREIQSMFFFLVLNLKQYQSFLPAHVLQMIEVRRLSHSEKHKSKKKRQPTAARKIITVEDELRSESSQDSHGQSRSLFGSVTSASQISKSNRLSHQFTLGMFRRNITVLHIQIINSRSMLQRVALQDFVNQHSQLVDVVSKLVSVTHSATLNSFTHDTLIISLNATISSTDHTKRAARLAVYLKRRIQALNDRLTQQAMEPFQTVISIASGESIVSTLGTSSQKQQVIFDKAVDHAEMQLRVTENLLKMRILVPLSQDGGVIVVLDQNTMVSLPKKHMQSRIVDLIAVKRLLGAEEGDQWRFHYLFELQDINMEGKKAQEWMYSLKDEISQEKLSKRNQRVTKAWTLLVAEEAHVAHQILIDLDGNTSTEEQKIQVLYKEMDISSSHGSSMSSPTDMLHTRLEALTERVATHYAGSLEQYCEEQLQSLQFGKDQLWQSLMTNMHSEEG